MLEDKLIQNSAVTVYSTCPVKVNIRQRKCTVTVLILPDIPKVSYTSSLYLCLLNISEKCRDWVGTFVCVVGHCYPSHYAKIFLLLLDTLDYKCLRVLIEMVLFSAMAVRVRLVCCLESCSKKTIIAG